MPKFNIKMHLCNIFPPIWTWEVKERKKKLFGIISPKPGQYLVKTVTMVIMLVIMKYSIFSVLTKESFPLKTILGNYVHIQTWGASRGRHE